MSRRCGAVAVVSIWAVVGCGLVRAGVVEVTDFKMAPGAADGRVLTCDANGVGSWQALPGGGAVPHTHFGETWTGSDTYGLQITNTTQFGFAIYGYAPATVGLTRGVYGRADSNTGAGVTGEAAAATGSAIGVQGSSASDGGTGVYGWATASVGTTYGGWFESKSTSGRGVYGTASAATGETFGVFGTASSSGGRGVYGLATASDGSTYGVYGRTASAPTVRGTVTAGVYGYATGTTGSAHGVFGKTDSNEGVGCIGYATAGQGSTVGVQGTVESSSGYAGYFSGGMGVFVEGDLACSGAKPFVEPHPDDPTKEIVYIALEGPEAGTYVRGTAELRDGEARIELPDHFALVTCADGVTVQLTPAGQWLQLYVAEKGPRVVVVREGSGRSGRFDYLVQGVRKGYEGHEVIRDRTRPPESLGRMQPAGEEDGG